MLSSSNVDFAKLNKKKALRLNIAKGEGKSSKLLFLRQHFVMINTSKNFVLAFNIKWASWRKLSENKKRKLEENLRLPLFICLWGFSLWAFDIKISSRKKGEYINECIIHNAFMMKYFHAVYVLFMKSYFVSFLLKKNWIRWEICCWRSFWMRKLNLKNCILISQGTIKCYVK